jgi:hypothetical protein
VRIYRCTVNHAGNRDMVIHKDQVSAAEIVLLRRIHGAEAVNNVEVVFKEARRRQANERERLIETYGAKRFAESFPGPVPRLPLTLAEAGLTEEGRDIGVTEIDEEAEAEPLPEPSAAAQEIAARVAAKAAGKAPAVALT